MTSDANIIQGGDPSGRPPESSDAAAATDIVSVNKKGSADNKLAKGLFLLLVGAILVGVIAWFSQDWLNARKAQLKVGMGSKSAEDTSQVFNPERTGTAAPKPKLGADGRVAASTQPAPSVTQASGLRDDGIRPVRGPDGKVMLNGQGRAMGVDKDGRVVEVPAIAAMNGDEPAARKPLPGPAGQPGTAGQQQGQQAPPSRYSGSLFVGEPSKPSNENPPVRGEAATASPGDAQSQALRLAELLRAAALGGGGQGARTAATASPVAPSYLPAPDQARQGAVGSALYSSATPVALAKRLTDQNLILPKGRQADCILTGRIIDEVPGFTSCVLAQNLYSDNSRVLLVERGSEVSGEYGVTNQLGMERLFVTWTRLKTPEGIEVDLSSPSADQLGGSGLPGHLDNRWGARIGAAFLLSFVKDVTTAIISKQMQTPIGGTSVTVQAAPGQNTIAASSQLAEEVIKQTLKVRPRLTINEGDRISIYVARDLDFSQVYALKKPGRTAGAGE